MSVFDTLGKSVGTVIDERLSSPLVSSFIIAWSLINYKFFVILVSNTSVTLTFELIRQICFPDWQAWMLNGFLYPLMAAAIYIFLLPYPSQFVYEHWRKHQEATNKIKFRYDEQGYETIERARQIRARNRELEGLLKTAAEENETLKGDLRSATVENMELKAQKPSSESEIADLTSHINHLIQAEELVKQQLRQLQEESSAEQAQQRGQINELKTTVELRQHERAKLQQELAKLQANLDSVTQQYTQLQVSHSALQELQSELTSSLESGPNEHFLNILRKESLISDAFDETQLAVLESMGGFDDIDRDVIREMSPDLTNVHVDYAIAELTNGSYIESVQEEVSGEALFRLTQRGRRILVRLSALQKKKA